jgi:hypothetical protein
VTRAQKIVLGVLALVLSVAGGLAYASFARTVDVRAGERVECTYGHLVSESIETISVPARKASEYGVKTSTIVCDKHRKAEALYREAQEALEKADLKTAEKKLREVVKLDSGFKQAIRQLEEIESGKKPVADNTGESGSNGSNSGGSNGSTKKPSTPGDDKPTGPVASLAGWIPDTLTGYKADKPITDVYAISRDYVPTSSSSVQVLVISAEQQLSAETAKASLNRDVKRLYAEGGEAVKINGRSGWVGSDGRGTAVLGLTDGPVIVIFQFTAEKGDATDLLGDLKKIAQTLPK